MAKHILSKSTFIRGQQCLKSLYLYKNRYFLKDPVPPEQMAKFARGWSVNELAHALHPGGIDVSPPSQKAVDRTAALMAEGQPVIYEAAFMYDDVLIAIDMLVRNQTAWKALEVKSSRSLSETYMKDAFLQYYVITGSGVQLDDFQLVHINPAYVRQGELDVEKLFSSVSVKQQCIEKSEWVKEQLVIEKQAVSAGKSPAIDIGLQCNNPYPCDFQRLCWKKVPAGSVFEMGGFSDEEKFALYNKGILTPAEIGQEHPLNADQQHIIEAHRTGNDYIDKAFISSSLKSFGSGTSFLASLRCRPAVPLYESMSPYSDLLYGVAIISADENGNLLSQKSFVASPAAHPTHQIAEYLSRELSDIKTMITWRSDSEILELAGAGNIEVFDLQTVFSRYKYYSVKYTESDDCIKSAVAIILNNNIDKRSYFSDTIAGAAFVNIAESVMLSKEIRAEDETEKLRQYSLQKATALKAVFEHLNQACSE